MGSIIYPTVNNTHHDVFFATVGGTPGTSEPNWDSNCSTTCPDGSGSTQITWTNAGGTLPNSTGPGGNVVHAWTLANDPTTTPTIFNGQTNKTWNCNAIADYTFNNTGPYEVTDCATNTPQFGNGVSAPNLTVTSTGTFNLGSTLMANASPTISSGFGGGGSVSSSNGSAAFRITVGTPAAATGVIGLPLASHGWNCTCTDITTSSATVFACKQTASGTGSATIGNFTSGGVSGNWAAGDTLAFNCMAF